MFAKFAIIIIAVFILISIAGCGSTQQPTSNPTDVSSNSQVNPTTDTEANEYQMLPDLSGKVASLKLDLSADGTTQKLKKGEVMSITLESNPSTGYSWAAKISDSTVLVLMGEPQFSEPSQSSTPIVGAPGTQTFYFQAADTGTSTVTLNYQRSWEIDVAPAQTFSIIVDVQ
jgi:inhibitor of cysteine peptidase